MNYKPCDAFQNRGSILALSTSYHFGTEYTVKNKNSASLTSLINQNTSSFLLPYLSLDLINSRLNLLRVCPFTVLGT